jgi:CRISPR-associated protein (TIGR02584 family)
LTIDPSGYPRRLLIGVVGLSPQVVTETLFSLIAQRDPPFLPTSLRLITSGQGAERVRLQLLDAENGAFCDFARDWAPQLKSVLLASKVDVLRGRDGKPLDDIVSAADGICAADMLLEIVREATSDPNCAVYGSIAGGRKTMGFLLGYALSLFGRAQDRLTHVLVNAPFQDHPQFFYPPPKPKILLAYPDNRPMRTDAARIVLTDIPFVRLRAGLPRRLLSGAASFAETIAEAQDALLPPSLIVETDSIRVIAHGRTVLLPPVEFTFIVWLARRRLGGEPHGGAVSWRDANHGEFLELYRALPSVRPHAPERLARIFAQGFERAWFEQRIARVNKLVSDALGPLAGPYLIRGNGRRPNTRYGLSADLQNVIVQGALECGNKT